MYFVIGDVIFCCLCPRSLLLALRGLTSLLSFIQDRRVLSHSVL